MQILTENMRMTKEEEGTKMINSYMGSMGSGMSYEIIEKEIDLKFNILDCSFVKLDQYRWLAFAFSKFNGIEFGYKLNSKNQKIYFIKDKFKQELEDQGIL